MIQFFRKIRQQLLTENKIGKYLTYASGEIALVMIGILLALQVNNWNEDRKNTITEKETLASLRSDLTSALLQLDIKLDQNKNYRTKDSILLDIINFKKDVGQDSLQQLALGHIWSPGFDPELGTLNEILNTGKMEIIKDKTLRKHISSWNKYMDELMEVDENLKHLDLQVKKPIYYKYLPIKNFMSKYMNQRRESNYEFPNSNFIWNSESLLAKKEFENMLADYMIYSSIQYERMGDIKENMVEMISLIDQNLQDD